MESLENASCEVLDKVDDAEWEEKEEETNEHVEGVASTDSIAPGSKTEARYLLPLWSGVLELRAVERVSPVLRGIESWLNGPSGSTEPK